MPNRSTSRPTPPPSRGRSEDKAPESDNDTQPPPVPAKDSLQALALRLLKATPKDLLGAAQGCTAEKLNEYAAARKAMAAALGVKD